MKVIVMLLLSILLGCAHAIASDQISISNFNCDSSYVELKGISKVKVDGSIFSEIYDKNFQRKVDAVFKDSKKTEKKLTSQHDEGYSYLDVLYIDGSNYVKFYRHPDDETYVYDVFLVSSEFNVFSGIYVGQPAKLFYRKVRLSETQNGGIYFVEVTPQDYFLIRVNEEKVEELRFMSCGQ